MYCVGRRVRRVAYFALCSDERNALCYEERLEQVDRVVECCICFVEGECVCSGLSFGCGEALVCVLCVGALRWGICLKGLVVARLTCLCLDFVLCCWTIFGFVGFLCVFFCWAIADREYSFLLIFVFVGSFFGIEGGLECIVLVEECGGWVILLLLV